MIAAHADWSMDARKRWVTIARRQGALWQASAPRLVGDPARLAAFLIAEGGPAALGLDLPLGVPRGFAEGRQEADFPGFLAGLAQNSDFFTVSPGLESVCPGRPFYPARVMPPPLAWPMPQPFHAYVTVPRQNAPPARRYFGRLAPINPARRRLAPGAIGSPPRLPPARRSGFGLLPVRCMICSAPASSH